MKKMKRNVAFIVAVLMFSSNSSLAKATIQAEACVMPNVNTELTREEFVENVRQSLNNPSYEAFTEASNTTNLGYYNWCAAYVSYYLGKDVTGSGNYNRDVDEIVKAYVAADRFYQADGTYEPVVGDLVVYDENGDETDGCEHIGVVSGVDSQTGEITTIEGNAYRWRPHMQGLDSEAKLNWYCKDSYELIFTPDEVYDIESNLGEQGFYEVGENYGIVANACWDYYYDSSKTVNSCEKRVITEFEAKDVKNLFIAGYCVPNFKTLETSVKEESAKDESVREESVKEESVKEESVKEKSVKDESLKEKSNVEESQKQKNVELNIFEKVADSLLSVVKDIVVSSESSSLKDSGNRFVRFKLNVSRALIPKVDMDNDGCVSVADVVIYLRKIKNSIC